jgi:hypothetical protein
MQVAYREVVKELLPENLYPTKKELRIALEEYLANNAEHYISAIGKNAWISLFTEKLYSEVSCAFDC